jgi:hypothetical protein
MDFVVVRDPVTKSIEVATKGPKGDKGDPGEVSQAALNGEAAARVAADTALQTAINGKAVARTTGHKSGLYYVPNGVATSGASFTLGQMYLWPFVVDGAWSIDRVGILVTAANSFAQRIGLYADQGDGTPGALLNDWGTVDGSTTTFSPITISKTFDPGVYWLACVMQGSVAGSVARCSLTDLLTRFCFTGTPVAGVHNPFRRDSVTGALPNPAGTLGSDIVNATSSLPPGPVFRSA